MGCTLKQSYKPVGRENNNIIAHTELTFGGHWFIFVSLSTQRTYGPSVNGSITTELVLPYCDVCRGGTRDTVGPTPTETLCCCGRRAYVAPEAANFKTTHPFQVTKETFVLASDVSIRA